MSNILNKIYNIIDKIGKRNIIIIILIMIVFLVTGLYQTFSLYTSSNGYSMLDGIKNYKFIIGENDTENSVVIAAGSSKNLAITVSNQDQVKLKYEIYYTTSDDLTNVGLGYVSSSEYPPTGLIGPNSKYVVTIKIYNNSNNNITINFGIIYGLENGGDLVSEENQHPLEKIFSYQTEVEYLGSTGTQYIDTDYYPNQNTRLEMVAATTSLDNSITYPWFGARYTMYERSFVLWQINGNFRRDYNNTQTPVSSLSLSIDTPYTIDMNCDSFSVDGLPLIDGLTGSSLTPFEVAVSLTLFTVKNELVYSDVVDATTHVDTRMSHLKLYSCKIWDNDTLVRDFIPVIDWDGTPCLYDKVNDELYYNNNPEAGEFYTNLTPSENKSN